MPGVYLVDEEGNPISLTNPLDVTASFTGGDIEIGSVEIKDGTTDTRAVVDATYGLSVDVKRAALPTGAALDTSITSLSAKFGSVGQKTMAASAPVVLASDQASIPTTRTGTARTMAHTSPTAGTSSVTALTLNASRKYALIVNDSANVVYIKLGATAVLNTGIRLNAYGGSYEINETNLYTGVIDCISSVASQTLLVTEGV